LALTKITTGVIADGAIPSTGIADVTYYTSSTTWTKSTRESALGVTLKKVIVEVIGAGGGGGGGRSNSIYDMGAPGGTSGAYCMKVIDVTSIASATITIGALGSGGAVNGAGSDGGSSSWADGTNTLTANGGKGGAAGQNDIATLATSVTASGGDINVGAGHAKCGEVASSGGNSSYGALGGDGGTHTKAPGGPGVGIGFGSTGDSAAKDAIGYGHGGGGCSYSNSDDRTGGDGAPGLVIVTEIAG